MRHLAAYLLLAVGGNAKPSAEEITNVLSQAGIESDSERLTALLAELDGKDINEIIALGKEKLMVGGAMAASGGGSAPAAAAGAGKYTQSSLVLLENTLNCKLFTTASSYLFDVYSPRCRSQSS